MLCENCKNYFCAIAKNIDDEEFKIEQCLISSVLTVGLNIGPIVSCNKFKHKNSKATK